MNLNLSTIRWRRIGLWSGAGLAFSSVALALTGIVYLFTADLNRLTPGLVAAAEKSLSATVEIGGPVRLHAFPRPHLSVADVRVSHPGDGAGRVRFTAAMLSGDLAFDTAWPPALGVIALQVSGAHLTLQPGAAPAGKKTPSTDDPGGVALGFSSRAFTALSSTPLPVAKSWLGLRLSPRDIAVTGLTVTVGEGPGARTLAFDRGTLTMDADGPDRVVLFADTGDTAFSVAGTFEPVGALLDGAPADIDAVYSAAGGTVEAAGTLSLGHAPRFTGTLKGQVPDLKAATAIAGVAGVPSVRAEFDLAVTGGPDAADIKGKFTRLGRGDLDVDIGFARTDNFQLIGSMRAAVLDVGAFLPAGILSADGRIVPDGPLPVAALRDGRVDLTITADDTEINGARLGALRVALWADKGIWVSGPATLALPGGGMTADLMIDVRAKPRLSLSLSASTTAPDALLRAAGLEVAPMDGRFDLAAEVYGSGYSLGEMVAGAQGQTNLLIATGGLPVWTASYVPPVLMAGIDTPADSAEPAGAAQPTVSACLVNRLDIEDGTAHSRIFLFDTDEATTAGAGSIDLAAERLSFTLRPRPKDPLQAAAAKDIDVSGPLLRPRITVKETVRRGLARATGSAALMFGPETTMPLLTLEAALANPCVRNAMGETAVANIEPTESPSP